MSKLENVEQESMVLDLSKAAQYLLEECRMVLPGIQALFGFQLIAVFSQTFGEKLLRAEQLLHLLALALVAIAVALVMTPAVIHRRTGPSLVTKKFLNTSNRLLMWSMYPLFIGICIDSYLIARIITQSVSLGLIYAGGILFVFVTCWFIFPSRHTFQPH